MDIYGTKSYLAKKLWEAALDRVVLCMKWGKLYGPDYVNVLYAACRENISGDFRFVCLTDDAVGLDPAIESFPIPDLGISAFDWIKGGWPKISAFKPDLYGLTGRCLFIDLDTVICGSLDEFFEVESEFTGIDTGPTWGRPTQDQKPLLGTGIFAFTLGAFPNIYHEFISDPQTVVAKYRIEQVFVQDRIEGISYWPRSWVESFKYHYRKPALIGLILPPRAPGPESRVIAFHGEPRPIDLVKGGLWGIFPNVGFGRVKWAVDYWKRHGGKP